MEGLLNFIKSPAGQGLLAAVAGGMAGAQRGTPWNNVGRGLVTGIQGYSGALDQESRAAQAAQAQEMQALQRQQMEMNMAAAQRQQQEAEAARAAQQQFIEQVNPQANALANPFAGEAGPSIPQVDPFQQQMYQAMQAGILPPQDWLKSQAPKQPEAFTLSPGQVRFQGDQKVAELQERQDPNKPFLGIDPATGQPIPNLAYQRYDLDKAARGAARTDVRVNTGNTVGTTVAKGVGEEINTSLVSARGAAGQVGTINRLRETLDSGNLFAGPTSKFSQYGAQLADVLGVTGKDTKEKLQNTRLAMQSMAQLELDAAAQMRGQGAITENERGIIRRAAAGEIDTMTVTELRSLTDVLAKVAIEKVKRHNQYAGPMIQQDQNLAPYLTIEQPSVYQWQQPSRARNPQMTGQFRIIGVE
jgi:hypothetical protein